MTTPNAAAHATADLHDALAALIRDVAPTINDPAYLAGQLLNDRYWALRLTRHSADPKPRTHARDLARHHAMTYATDRTLAAVLDHDTHARIIAAADRHADTWERQSWARDEAQRAEQRRAYPEWLTDHLATHHGS